MLFIYKAAHSKLRTFWLKVDQRLHCTLECSFPIIILFNVITMVIRFPVKYLHEMIVWVPGCVESVHLGRPERQLVKNQNGLIGSFYLLFQLLPDWVSENH